jgi:serine/threonine protein kinase
MRLAPGTRIGPYEVISMLGAGGMGEVYEARDSRLKREVALKILPDAFASDPERMARLEREAQVLAALNHPHIAQIHGLEESADVRALVMEFVEGQDLAQKIVQGPIPLEETLLIARQIAQALEAAHEKGIIHRDLKPANIKVTSTGEVKVLDFGLAKLIDSHRGAARDLANSPTVTTASTTPGVILGTAAYMPPSRFEVNPLTGVRTSGPSG